MRDVLLLIRWALIPAASFAAWWVGMIVGAALLSGVQHLCHYDPSTNESDVSWYFALEKSVLLGSTAASGALVVAAAFFVAPIARRLIAWVVFAIGAWFAFSFAIRLGTWDLFASAILGGLLTTVLLHQSWFADSALPLEEPSA